MSSATPSGTDPDWLMRPEAPFRDLPLKIRWELTRRHPTYLLAWRPALKWAQHGPFADDVEALLCQAAAILLGGISVAGEPLDPATTAEQFMEGLGPEWLGGLVRPISLRGMATLLYSLLPPGDRLAVGEVFVRSASTVHAIPDDDRHNSQQAVRGLQELGRLPRPGLDQFAVDQPLFYVSMEASQRAILEEMTHVIRRYHDRIGREDRRTRHDSLDDDLAVWDRREGWTGAGYDTGHERKLREIAVDLGIPLPTAHDRYRAGFRWVTGWEFTPERWMRLMGLVKLVAAGVSSTRALGIHTRAVTQQFANRSQRPVPESRLQRGRSENDSEAGIVTGGSAAEHDFELADLLMDFDGLSQRGLSDAAIASRLELPVESIVILRERRDEFRSL